MWNKIKLNFFVYSFNLRNCLHIQKRLLQNNVIIESRKERLDENWKKLERQFPHPKGTLNNIINDVRQNMKNDEKLISFYYKPVMKNKVTSSWACSCQIQWPSDASFSATAKTKQKAAHIVSLQILHWLQSLNRLKDKRPVIEVNKKRDKSVIEIKLPKEISEDFVKILDYYQKVKQVDCTKEDDDVNSDNIREPESVPLMSESEKCFRRNKRNQLLQQRFFNRDVKDNHTLPIANFRQQIIEAIEKYQVVIIKGEPGCGKSTQVPQYIADDWVLKGKGAECNILIGQPRRISAISLAEWVASERAEEVGDVVGYHVRFNCVKPRLPEGSIVFCSTGMLLRLLQDNPLMEDVSHIILDEAHNRDVNTDLLLFILKELLPRRPLLKLIVMSATINTELFQNYYPRSFVINVPGFTHHVQSYFIEELSNVWKSAVEVKSCLQQANYHWTIDHQTVAKAIEYIHCNKPAGAVLCFLPGWQDIKIVSEHLKKSLDSNTCVILPLHSRLSQEQQRKVFRRTPEGIRKIILSTNVAETSITIDDVSYVIETGLHKEERLLNKTGITTLENELLSKANVSQRKGRAGRVKPGECFHLYSREIYNSMLMYPIPELKRIPLHKIVLDLKTFYGNEKLAEILQRMPEPPDTLVVQRAVKELIDLGALTEEESLTSLGQRIIRFSTDPRLSKAVVYSLIFRCFDRMLTIAAVLSAGEEIFQNSLEESGEAATIKKSYHQFSDHLALSKLFNEWFQVYEEDDKEKLELFCIRHMLRDNTMHLINRIRNLLIEQIEECGMIQEQEDLQVSDEFIVSLLFASLQNVLFRRSWDVQGGRMKPNKKSLVTMEGNRAKIMSESVNSGKEKLFAPFLTYYREKMSTVRKCVIIRDTSVIPPLAFGLFPLNRNISRINVSNLSVEENPSITTLQNNVSFRVIANKSNAALIQDLGTAVSETIQYFLITTKKEQDENYLQMRQFADQLTVTLSMALSKASYVQDK